MSVIVCAYTELRWPDLEAALSEVLGQRQRDDEVIVVIDHNKSLLERVTARWPFVKTVPNAAARGLSGARNTGIGVASTEAVLFLDDDACPASGWMEAFRRRFNDPSVSVVGGAVQPLWDGGSAPAWFPEEYGWVVGCDYIGLPPNGCVIRNPVGASMGIRRSAFDIVPGFSDALGRLGSLPVGCEETEFCIRLRQLQPSAVIIRDTTAVVHHRVPLTRQSLRYFLRRCYYEGKSKATLSSLLGINDGLSVERAYVLRVLAGGMLRDMRDCRLKDFSGLARAFLILAGLGVTTTGYGIAYLQIRSQAKLSVN